jgi:hypothetical protein
MVLYYFKLSKQPCGRSPTYAESVKRTQADVICLNWRGGDSPSLSDNLVFHVSEPQLYRHYQSIAGADGRQIDYSDEVAKYINYLIVGMTPVSGEASAPSCHTSNSAPLRLLNCSSDPHASRSSDDLVRTPYYVIDARRHALEAVLYCYVFKDLVIACAITGSYS